MCLRLYKEFHQLVPYYASHDVECIKLLEFPNYLKTSNNIIKVQIHSPIQGFRYIVGKKYHLEEMAPEGPYLCGSYKILRGFHSFQSLGTAIQYRKEYAVYARCKVCKCIIPKGSWYYDGLIGFTADKGYVSDSIIIKEIMEE